MKAFTFQAPPNILFEVGAAGKLTAWSERAPLTSLEDIGQLHQEVARGAKTRLTRMKS